jgi:ABC-type polysaccharide/polyol phosphate export permease
MATVGELTRSRELLVNLTLRELRGRYKRSTLGWAWSLLNPLVTMGIFALVFRFFLKIEPPRGNPSGLKNFAFHLLCGLLAWNMLAGGMTAGMSALIGNANLIKKVYFPRQVLVAATVGAVGVSFLIETGVLLVALLFVGNMVLPWVPILLVVMIMQVLFVLGIAMLLAVLNVYFRDVQHFIALGLQVWFYATPIIYPIGLVPKTAQLWGHEIPVRTLYDLNPMVHFIEAYRDLLYHLRMPSIGHFLFMAVATAVSLVFGWWVFGKLEPRLAEEL